MTCKLTPVLAGLPERQREHVLSTLTLACRCKGCPVRRPA